MAKSKSLTKNSIFYLVYSVLNILFPFITGIYVARTLLPVNIGQVEAARNLAQYFVIFAFLGIPTYGLREIAKVKDEPDKLNKLYSELMIINAISTITFLSLFIGLVFAIPQYRAEWPLYLIASGSIALNLLDNSWMYEGIEEFGFISLRNLIFKILSFVGLVLLVKGPDDYMLYAMIAVIGVSGNNIVSILFSRKFVHFTIHGLSFRQHMKPILYLVVVNLAIEIYSLVDVTMLKWISGDESVAFYSYGSKVYKIFLQVINSITYVVVPRLSMLYKENKQDEFNQLISKTLKIILLISLPMIVGIWLVADYFLVLIYGEAYIASAKVLKILCFILALSPVGYLLGSRTLLVTGHEKYMVIAVGSGAIINIILNAILIPNYHETGAAIASVCSEAVVMSVYIFLGHRYFKLTRMKGSLIKQGIALGLMIAYLIGMMFVPFSQEWMRIIAYVAGAIFIYGLSLVLSKEENTIALLHKLLGKFIRV